jgi:hypothetical protein
VLALLLLTLLSLFTTQIGLHDSLGVDSLRAGRRITGKKTQGKGDFFYPTGKKTQGKTTNSDFFYPNDMPRPPQMWVEGFAARLHAGPIQKYETPIQVWQTWRLDQVRKVLTPE